ncbi:MAG: helix-turn-helix domain-containing protein, partial [Flavobacteriia bacterium]|nr:helix-turn-helix domain-containing protein [Flavobacteriia bacterium]
MFWQAMQSGVNMKEAARMAGISYASATKWVAKAKATSAELDKQNLEFGKPSGGNALKRDLAVTKDLPPVVPPS